MNYLFFDIECSDGIHMCSFGYVLVDDKFNILDKKDILINPKAPFRLGRDEFNPNVELAYPVEEFLRQKVFSFHYDEIRDLILNKCVMPVGHSVQSDMSFIRIACGRYGKELIEYRAFDTQRAYALYTKTHNRKLHAIVEELGIDTGGIHIHKSCDDAELTMRVAENMCEKESCTLVELIEKYPSAVFELKNEEETDSNKGRRFGRL